MKGTVNAAKAGSRGAGRGMRRAWPSWFKPGLIAFCAIVLTAAVSRAGDGGKRDFTCVTGNAYVGADLAPALSVDPSNPQEVITTVTGIYLQILASDPPARLAGLARQIAAARPDVAGLVEMYSLETAPMTAQGPGPFTVTFDFLNLLTNELCAAGAPYKVAVISTESDIILPLLDVQNGGLMYGRLIDHEVILYRADLPPGHLRLSNAQSGQFAHFIEIQDIGLSVNRGWCAVDVFTRGERFRCICTHLEEETVPTLQLVQAQELLAGPADVRGPVLLLGDFNADPLHRNGTITYDLFQAAGFKDAWTATHPGNPAGGLTWGHDPALADPDVPFVWRLDLVLFRGNQFHASELQVLDGTLGRVQPPFWASDHAAVKASFNLGNDTAFKSPRGK